MKKELLLLLLTIISTSSFGQWIGNNYDLNFEDSTGILHITIDTISNPDNIWQIGAPQKTLFTNAFSLPKAIVTDTINTYPINDTSVFTITNVASGHGFEMPHTVILSGQYFVNSDTLSDYGTIEFSPDNGNIWIDLINDTIYNNAIWWNSQKPNLTGNSNGWQYFYANIAQLGPIFNIHDGDTILYRFKFISDSVQSNKDGLMFDSFHFEDWVEGIEEIQNNNLISIFPNPASDLLTIKRTFTNELQSIQVINCNGQILYTDYDFTSNFIDIRTLKNGVYYLKYSNTKEFSIKIFVVDHNQ